VGSLKLRIVPNAKRNEVVGEYGSAVKIKVAAPAVDGKANGALIEYLATLLDVPMRAVEIASGAKGRDKLISVSELSADEIKARLLAQ
jgi:uncharacterized protein (TIGR00251 family)